MKIPMAAGFELRPNAKGQYHFVLKAGNGEVVLSSVLYESKASAEDGIACVQRNSPFDAHYERKTADDGRLFFNLTTNHQVIGSSPAYSSIAEMEVGIKSVKAKGPGKTISVV